MVAIPEYARRALLVLTLGALAAVGCSPLIANGPQQNSYRVNLDDSRQERREIGMLRYRGGLALSDRDPDFGGLSGIEVSADGQRFIAISDKGAVVDGILDYDDAGDLTGARDISVMPLLDIDGTRVKGNRRDSEGLALLPDGRWAVSFERWHRVELYAPNPAGPVTPPLPKLPRPPGVQSAEGNSGLEVLTALPDGRLLVMEEGREENAGFSRVWIGGENGWASLSRTDRPTRRRCPTAMSWCWSAGPRSSAGSGRGSCGFRQSRSIPAPSCPVPNWRSWSSR
jgi:hypothetical protein